VDTCGAPSPTTTSSATNATNDAEARRDSSTVNAESAATTRDATREKYQGRKYRSRAADENMYIDMSNNTEHTVVETTKYPKD
jgi:hypothetical protein